VNTGGTVTEHDAVLVGERGCTLRVPLTVTAATMVIICDLVDNPPKPTPELIEIMRRQWATRADATEG